jgi:hypothetical protein
MLLKIYSYYLKFKIIDFHKIIFEIKHFNKKIIILRFKDFSIRTILVKKKSNVINI